MTKYDHTFVILAYKESKFLEECLISVLSQKKKCNIVVATSTPNEYIYSLAKKYSLPVIVNSKNKKGIGYDFEFARLCKDSELITIAHQDDIYCPEYSSYIQKNYEMNPNALILFTDYFEIRNGKKIYTNINLKVKRVLLFPLHFKKLSEKKIGKRLSIAFGNSICCPAVTFVNKNIVNLDVFSSDLKCNVDWRAWEILSKETGSFVFVRKCLMGHRVHGESTTTEIIKNNIRTKEDYQILSLFWPSFIARIIAKIYSLSEKSN